MQRCLVVRHDQRYTVDDALQDTFVNIKLNPMLKKDLGDLESKIGQKWLTSYEQLNEEEERFEKDTNSISTRILSARGHYIQLLIISVHFSSINLFNEYFVLYTTKMIELCLCFLSGLSFFSFISSLFQLCICIYRQHTTY